MTWSPVSTAVSRDTSVVVCVAVCVLVIVAVPETVFGGGVMVSVAVGGEMEVEM